MSAAISVSCVCAATIRNQVELLAEYAAECSVPGLPPFKPCWALYEVLEATGSYRVFAAFNGESIVGFAAVLTTINPHYTQMIATVESLFVTKASRDGMTSARLMEAIEDHARVRGCKAILYSAPAGGDLEAVLGKRYARTNAVFYKPLWNPAGDAGDDPGGGRSAADAAAG